MPFAQVRPELSMYYEDHCFAPPWRETEAILLLHGGGRSSTHYIGWVPVLGPHLRVLRVDLPGHGRTIRPPGHVWSLPNASDELSRLLDAIGIDAVHIAGDHLGAALSLQFAASHPERARTVTALVHGAALVGDVGKNRRAVDQWGIIEQLRQRGSYREDSPESRFGSRAPREMVEYWTKQREAANGLGGRNVDAIVAVAEADLPGVLARIAAPTLLLVPNRNASIPLRNVIDTRDLIADAEVVVIASDSHDIALAEPEVSATECLRFIQRVAARPKRPRTSTPAGAHA